MRMLCWRIIKESGIFMLEYRRDHARPAITHYMHMITEPKQANEEIAKQMKTTSTTLNDQHYE